MRKYTYILALFVFFIAAAAVRATPVDPRIIVSGSGDPTAVETPVFTFMSDAMGGGVLQFINDSGIDWLSLDFFVQLPSGSVISCPPGSPAIYNTCESSSTNIPGTPMAAYDIGFDNPVGKGVVPGGFFSINLDTQGNATDGAGGWGADNTFVAVANLPEPSSFFFLAGGILLLGGLRLRSRRIYF